MAVDGTANPAPAQQAAMPAAPATDNSGKTEGTGQKPAASLLTGNIESMAAGTDPAPASQASTDPAPKQRPAWKAQATKELQDNDSLDRFPTISELGKSYLELEGKLGRSVEIPGDNATAEDVEAYYRKIGRPDKIEDYEFTKPALPEGARFDETLEKEFRDEAYKLGLNKKQAAALWDMQTTRVVTQVTNHAAAQRAELEATKAAIRTAYGENAERELAMTQNFMRTSAEKIAPGLCAKIEKTGLGNSIELLKLMNHFAHRTSEDSFARNGETAVINGRAFDYNIPAR